MKKANYQYTFIVLLLSLLITTGIAAQTSSTYIFVKPIYGFPANGAKLNENSAVIQGVTYTKGVYGSYARGFLLQAGIGKMISNTFGFELAGEWIPGKKIKGEAKEEDDAAGVFSERINAFLIKPMLVLRNSGDLLAIYSKLGLAISPYSRRHEEANVVLSVSGQNYQIIYSAVEKIKTKVGFTAAFGLSFRVSQAIAITGEVNGQMISLPVVRGHYTAYSMNGTDMLPSLNTNIKTWTYEKSISTAAGNPDTPGTRIYEPANFSYIGASVGLRYFF